MDGFNEEPKKSVILKHVKLLAVCTDGDGYKNTGNYVVTINDETKYVVEV